MFQEACVRACVLSCVYHQVILSNVLLSVLLFSPGWTAGAPGSRDSIQPVPYPQNVCVMHGPLDDGGVPEECHNFLRALPEVLQHVYVMKVPVYL